MNLYDDLMIRPSQPSSLPQPVAQQRLSDQLAADLRRQIEGGTVQPGQRLPTEQALAAPADAFATTADVPAALRLCLGAPADRAAVRRMLAAVAETLSLPSTCAGVI